MNYNYNKRYIKINTKGIHKKHCARISGSTCCKKFLSIAYINVNNMAVIRIALMSPITVFRVVCIYYVYYIKNNDKRNTHFYKMEYNHGSYVWLLFDTSIHY